MPPFAWDVLVSSASLVVQQLRSLPDSSAVLERVHRHFVVPGEVDLNKMGTLAAFAHVLVVGRILPPGGWEL